jgi:hypothetical protein
MAYACTLPAPQQTPAPLGAGSLHWLFPRVSGMEGLERVGRGDGLNGNGTDFL